ncbi:hypothetical protein [Flammeovirga sp. EKP202]|uniref:hypothetical protein n=1 Tax=Flammeovirga sp. EKP202 TaxID=2770592 RepID=UPI00165F04E8|nr:hypothetical protein [Flammeovirga sp. EKP202]MBD0404949.1 hypothetical protein [Flammeovirga sp. EKP202]
MKKQTMKFVAILAVSIFSFGSIIATPSTNLTEEATTETVVVEEDEAIRCKVYSGGQLVAECWLCSCSKLLEAL